jgi:hypothetical protein
MYHTTTMYGPADLQFYAPAALLLREESPLLTAYEAGWGPTAGMDGLEKGTISAPAGNWTPNSLEPEA